MTNTIRADVLAIKALLCTLLSELDDDSIQSLHVCASDLIRNASLSPQSVKDEAVVGLDNLLDLGGVNL